MLGRSEDTSFLRTKQQAQEKAQSLAGELISAVLDVQLRQLEENGLKELPIYRDVQGMRANLGGLVQGEMRAIVALLVEAQQGPPADRTAKFNAARGKIREVVAQLMAERQKLYRRMQVAKLAAEVRDLMLLQGRTNEVTRSLLGLAASERERLALAAIEDQADVQKLYLQLVAALADVGGWGGQAAAGALDGLRILRAAQVEPELQRAGEELGRASFAAAAESQQAVLKGLAGLLERLEETQGLTDGDREAALRLVRELLARQQQLREQTKAATLTPRTAEPLIEQQTALQKELGKLAGALASFPPTEPLIEQAKAASFEATASLFEELQAPAAQQQLRVATSLAQIEKLLEQGRDAHSSGLSADELAAEVARLAALKQRLDMAAGEQAAASANAANKPQIAAQQQGQVQETLQGTKELGQFFSLIEARLEDANEKAEQAARWLTNLATDAAVSRQAASEEALAAIKLAQAEVAAQLADAQRQQKAVEVGELARAAEALERASAAERTISRLASEAAQKAGLEGNLAAALATEQADVAAVAEHIAAGAKNTAPEVGEMLREAQPAMIAAASALQAVQSPAAAARVSSAAESAAAQLTAAAAALRQAQGRAAKELERIAGEQLASATAARSAVDEAREVAQAAPVEDLQGLTDAKEKLADTLIEQARADGREAEANAQALARLLDKLAGEQRAADEAALDLAGGRTNYPLEAASRQQEVADHARELTKQSPPEIAEPLAAAAQAAGQAARQILAGNPAQAEAGRAAVRAALAQARHAAAGKLPQAEQPNAVARAQLERLDQAIRDLSAKHSARLSEWARQATELAERAAQVDSGAAAALAQAKGAAERGIKRASDPELAAHGLAQVQRKIEQAVANLAAREQQLRRDRELAEVLAGLAAEQQAAREAIAKAAAEFARPAAAPGEQVMAAQALMQAQQQFAAAQTATGEGAAEVSGQPEVANLPIREGLEIASRLGRGEGAGDRSQESGDRGQETGDSEAAAGTDPKSKIQNPKSAEGQLGTGMVPAAPQITAKQIAGPAANAAAAAMAAAMKGMGKGKPGEGQGESETPQEGAASSTAKKGGASKGGKTAKNERPEKGDLEQAAAADADSRATGTGEDVAYGSGSVSSEPWFAKLPPELRSAIQAKSRGKAPRGYEERLRRYFESVD